MDHLSIDIELRRGEFMLAVKQSLKLSGITGIFGANGSGKTSLLRVIAGLEPAATGELRCRSEVWHGPNAWLRAESRAIGYVFQEGRLFSHLDVKGNLEFPRKQGRRSGPIAFDETVKAFDLEPLLSRHPADLSGGERQRVAIARALLANPALLLMDEPLSSLDAPRKRELAALIKQLPAQFQIPVVYVTHDVDELVYLADSVVLMAGGRNVAHGSAREILARTDFARLAELENAGNVIEGQIASHTEGSTIVSLADGELRIPRINGVSGDAVRLRVNPRDVVLATERLTGISIRNCLPARVQQVETRADNQVIVSLTVGEQLMTALVTADAARELDLQEGRPIYALIKTVALDAFAHS